MHTTLIVGFGAIGKIVYRYLAQENQSNINIYAGRQKNSGNSVPDVTQVLYGTLDEFIESFQIPKDKKIEIYWCCGPDYLEESDNLQKFLHDTIDCPLNLIKKLENECSANYSFIHFSTMAGFEGQVVKANETSFAKRADVLEPYSWAKRLLDCALENQIYSGAIINLRLSNLITSDYSTSERKVIVRIAKKLKQGLDVEVQKNIELDFIIEDQVKSALDLIKSKPVWSGSINICNGERFYLYDLINGVKVHLHNDGLKTGKIVPKENTENTNAFFEPTIGIKQIDLKQLLASLMALI